MKNRRAFLTAFGLSGMTFAFAARADSQTNTPAPATTPSSSPAPSASSSTSAAPSTKPPSAAAAAVAATMRRFDAKLSDSEIETIARGIDANAGYGARLDPKRKPLRNGDEPVTSFVVPFA